MDYRLKDKVLPALRDIHFIGTILLPIKLNVMWLQYAKRNRWSIADLWDDAVKRFPKRPALRWSGREYTYAELDRLANRTAEGLLDRGVVPKAQVAVFGENIAPVIWHVIACYKIGAVPVILRPSQSPQQLELFLRGHAAIPHLFGTRAVLAKLPESLAKRFGQISEIAMDPGSLRPPRSAPPPRVKRDVRLSDPCFQIGSSGTRLNSKASEVHHGSILAYLLTHKYKNRLRADDVLYCYLTLSHGGGLAVGVMAAWTVGACVFLGDGFDPNTFFKTCAENGVTVFNYVGTIPRQLLRTPPGEYDRRHKVRLVGGHEMLPTVWEEFQERFGIRDIAEYYASTEGTVLFINKVKPGAVGFVGPLTKQIYPFAIVRLDENNEIEMKDGRPVECAPGEVGEVLGFINSADPLQQMNSYVDASLNQDAVVRSLFKDGDEWYRTGDLVRHDPDGFIQHMGRVKSSIRIGGRFVNPQAIEDKLMRSPELQDCYAFAVHPDAAPHESKVALLLQRKRPMAPDALRRWLETSLDRDELPSYVVWVDESPCQFTDSYRRSRAMSRLTESELRTRYPAVIDL